MTSSIQTPNTQTLPIQTFPVSILSVSQEELTDAQLIVTEGELPTDLMGHAFILMPSGNVDSQHLKGTPIVYPSADGTPLVNGNGLVYRLDFDQPGKVRLNTKIAKTPCYYADDATKAGTETAEYGFQNFGLARLSPWLGVRSIVNTAVIPMKFDDENERLMLTCDVGRPFEIDPQSLELITPVGWNREWEEQLPLDLPFEMTMNTAHPGFDSHTQEIFTVNYLKSLSTLLSSVLKTDEQQLIHHIQKILHKFLNFLEHPLSPEGLAALAEIAKIIEHDIEDFAEGFLDFWHDLQELIQAALAGKEAGLLDELKQLVILVGQILEGLSKIDDRVYLIRWDGEGDFERWPVKLEDGSHIKIKQTIHQMAVTQDYIVLMDTGFKVGPEQLITHPVLQHKKLEKLIRNLFDYQEASETPVYIIRRSDLTKEAEYVIAKQVTLSGAVLHFLADYENPDHQIVLHVSHTYAWDAAEWTRSYDTYPYEMTQESNSSRAVGMMTSPFDIHGIARYTIDGETGQIDELASKVIIDPQFTWSVAMFAYNPSCEASKFDNLYWNCWGCWGDLLSEFITKLYHHYPHHLPSEEIIATIAKGLPANLCRLATDSTSTMAIADSYQFPLNYFPTSPQFIPRKGGDGSSTDGYLICTVLVDDRSELWLFDAQNLAKGALCKLHHPQMKFSFTTHTAWLPEIAPRNSHYYVPVREDYQAMVKRQSPQIQQLFEAVVYPKFPDPPLGEIT